MRSNMPLLNLATDGDLEDLALELGASVQHDDGRVFNAAQRSGVRRLPVRPPNAVRSEPVPAALPTEPAPQTELLRLLTEMLARPSPEIPAAPPAQVIVQTAARTGWEFAFKRNPDGTISSITATPKD
jgi:hypothetical protein